MAVSQSQVDHIIASASSDDPEVKLLQLQDEVELIKTSIKRLLIDIRERMNDLENPIVSSMASPTEDGVSAKMAGVLREPSSAIESAASAIKSTSETKKRTRRKPRASPRAKGRSHRNSRPPLPPLHPRESSRGRRQPSPPASPGDRRPNFWPRSSRSLPRSPRRTRAPGLLPAIRSGCRRSFGSSNGRPGTSSVSATTVST